jgi:hypothetical protein
MARAFHVVGAGTEILPHLQLAAKSVRRSAQDDDFVGIVAKHILKAKHIPTGKRLWDGVLGYFQAALGFIPRPPLRRLRRLTINSWNHW